MGCEQESSRDLISQSGRFSSRVAIDYIGVQELPHWVQTSENLNRKLSLTEVICQLKTDDVRRFEAIRPAVTVKWIDDNIFDGIVY